MLTWTGSLAPGDSATITYSVTVNNPDTGGKLLINTVASSAVGSTCPPGTTSSPCQVTVPVLTPALTIVKTASAATAAPGQTVTYTITVTDSGQTPYTGATLTDPLAGVLDDAAYNNNAAATAGSVSYAAPNLTWTGNLVPGAAATITYSVTVEQPRHRERNPRRHRHLAHRRQQLPGRQHPRQVHRHRRCQRAHDRQHREHTGDHPGRGRRLHDHGDQQRAGDADGRHPHG